MPDVMRRQGIYERRIALFVLEQRGDVIEQNARLGEIWNGSDECFKRLAVDRSGWGIRGYQAPSI